jgi:hypothetical protein
MKTHRSYSAKPNSCRKQDFDHPLNGLKEELLSKNRKSH